MACPWTNTQAANNAKFPGGGALSFYARCLSLKRWQEPIQKLCDTNNVRGTLLLAHEGINGTIAGEAAGIATVLAGLRALPAFAGLEHKESRAREMPFFTA